jgi:CRISPR/Cas system CSM-associated protein Csm2 small subunit
MITDKDREEAKTLCERMKVVQSVYVGCVRRPDEIKQIFNTPEDIERFASFISRIRRESADQARKEAAERVACAWREHGEGITLRTIRDAILDDSATDHIHDSEKLAVAVKALEYVVSKSLPSSAFESHYSRLQDACAKASDALKEIQG